MSQPTDHLAEADERPWEEPGLCRMDCEPHRGPFLLLLGMVSLGCAALGIFILVPTVIGLPLGVVAVLMARGDLSKMRAGRMDPSGLRETEKAWDRAVAATAFNTVGFAGLFACALLVLRG